LAERTEKALKKGNLIYVEGKIAKRKWQDKEGNDRYTTEIVCSTYKLLEKRDSSNLSGDNFSNIEDGFPSDSVGDTDSKLPDDDLPF
jgi:single-strand DNA-binding protein